jgi:hypothetical protein
MDPADDLPADVLAEIEADVARYRAARINAARKRIKRLTHPAFVVVTLAEQADIARRWLRGESMRAIARSLDWDPVSISSTLDAFTVGFRPDFDFDHGTSRRNEVEAALAKFDRGEPPERQPKVRRFSAGHLEERRATRRATERGSP